ncbi:MAG: GC-type dockerin domain-anchored protein [Phycisphaerales bacterium]
MKPVWCLCCAFLAPSGTAEPFSIDWYSVDAGGGELTGSVYRLVGTIGQAEASGNLVGFPLTIEPGFWSGAFVGVLACPADLDQNGTLNFDDIDLFVAGFLASDLIADLDGNGVLNFDDIDLFVISFLAGCS